MASPVHTPRAEKRAGRVTSGSSISAMPGLRGPPLTAMLTPRSTWELRTVAATTYSGRVLFVILGRSTADIASCSATGTIGHQPTHGIAEANPTASAAYISARG